MNYRSVTSILFRSSAIGFLLLTVCTALFAEVCLPPLTIEIAESITDIPRLSLPHNDTILELVNRARVNISTPAVESSITPSADTEPEVDRAQSNSEITTQSHNSLLVDFIMDIPAQLQQQSIERLRGFSTSFESYLENHLSTNLPNQTTASTVAVPTDEALQSTSQPNTDTQQLNSQILPSVNQQAVTSTQHRAIVVQPQITRLVISLSSTEQNSVFSVEISNLLIFTDNYTNPQRPDIIRSYGHAQQRIVLSYTSTEQQLVQQISGAIDTVLQASINSAIDQARRTVLREYSQHLATDRAFTFISIGSSNGITVGTKLQLISTGSTTADVCGSDKFSGLLQVAEQYDDYLVAHTRGDFNVPPNALLVSKPETVAIQPFMYTLIPAIQFEGYSNAQQFAFGSGVRLYPRNNIDRLQPFFAITVDAVLENEGVLIPLHGWVGLGMNWYNGRITISPRLSGGLGIGPYLGNAENITGIFASGIASANGSLLLSASLELGIELGYQFGISIADTTQIDSQSLQTGYGGVFIGGTLTFFE